MVPLSHGYREMVRVNVREIKKKGCATLLTLDFLSTVTHLILGDGGGVSSRYTSTNGQQKGRRLGIHISLLCIRFSK